jgi:predicted acyltransferase
MDKTLKAAKYFIFSIFPAMNDKPQRSLALDVFRGMTVCFMIIVNTPGSETFAFSPLKHAAWHGFTPTDLVFPSFLFAVGNAMSFSMKKFGAMSQGAVVGKIVRRTLLIFLLGYLMYWFPFVRQQADGHWGLMPISHTRIMGVLERIGLCYGIASLLIYYLKPRTVVIISCCLLIGYWIILLTAGVPGADPFSMTGNAGYRLDRLVLGENHMYHGEGIAFDPEGLLSTLPAVVNVVAGYFAGVFISRKGKEFEGLTLLLLWGCGLIALALVWNTFFPINKKLWTSSFVLLTVGIDLVLLAFLIYFIEFRHKMAWTSFFNVFGKNPLFIYLLSELLVVVLFTIPTGDGENLFEWVNRVVYQALLPGAVGSLLFALTYMMVCWSVGKWLDYKKIYIRV